MPRLARPVVRTPVTIAVAFSLLLSVGAQGAAAAPDNSANPLSMWVWSDDDPAPLVTFASKQGVDRLYVYVYRPRGGELARLEHLADLADDAGIELWALSGDPRWALHHRDVLAWQRRALATGLFVGTHLDVEPYALRAWDTRREHVIARYVRMLERVGGADSRALHVDLPFWFGDFDAPRAGGDTLADAVLDIVDGVTVMSYRDTATGPNSLSAVAADMLDRAGAAVVPIELAVETNPLDDCAHCTFYEEGAVAMREVIATVHDLLAGHRTYTGFAVHDFDGFRALAEEDPWSPGS